MSMTAHPAPPPRPPAAAIRSVHPGYVPWPLPAPRPPAAREPDAPSGLRALLRRLLGARSHS